MKTLIKLSILLILLVNIQCKKQQPIEPTPEPTPITDKKFRAHITFKQDSLGTIFLDNNVFIKIFLAKNDSLDERSKYIQYNYEAINSTISSGSEFKSAICNLYIYQSGIKLTESLGYYIKVYTCLNRKIPYQAEYKWYIKYHVFNEGDNGTINFNDL